jgi:FKBP-type peptidyl-prolyl cis-trans isomerase
MIQTVCLEKGENMKKALCWTSLCDIILLFTAAAFATQKVVVTESGFSYIDLEGGGGQTAEIGKIAVIHFTAWLDDNNIKGEIIFNSRKHGKPVSFKLGTGRVIQAWNLGVAGMKVGGKRRLMVYSEMAYGAKGSGNVIPPHTDLIYDIELIEVK